MSNINFPEKDEIMTALDDVKDELKDFDITDEFTKFDEVFVTIEKVKQRKT